VLTIRKSLILEGYSTNGSRQRLRLGALFLRAGEGRLIMTFENAVSLGELPSACSVAPESLDAGARITFVELPGTVFFSEKAFSDNLEIESRYEAAIGDYEQNGCREDLYQALAALGYDDASIWWHIRHRGQRMARGFI
jgi:hypothetical protein